MRAIPETLECEAVAEPRTPSVQLTSSSLLIRNTSLNILGEAWTFLVLLVAMPKLVSFLGNTAFGLFSLAWVVIGYLTFLDIGVNRAATKFVSEHLATRDERAIETVVRTALLTNVVLGFAGGVLIVVSTPFLVASVFNISADLRNEARLTFYAVALVVPVLLTQGILRAVLSSYQRFGWINVVNAAATTAQWALAAILAWRHFGVAFVVLTMVIVRLLATAVYAIVLSRLLPTFELFRPHCLQTTAKLLRFGSWVSVSQVIGPVLVYLDRVLIASFASLGAVTLYTVPYEVMTRLRVVPSSMMNALYPAFSERGLDGQQAQLQRLYERSVRYLLVVLLPGILFLVVLGPDALSLWMGRSFAIQSAAVLQILALGVLANGIAYIPYNMLQAVGRPDLTGKFHLLELAPYVVLCFVLIPRWGIEGAALASTVRFALDAGLLFWATRSYCGCTLRSLWSDAIPRIAMLTFGLGILLVGVRFAVTSPWPRITYGIASLLIYFLLAWFVLVQKNDRRGLTSVLGALQRQPIRS